MAPRTPSGAGRVKIAPRAILDARGFGASAQLSRTVGEMRGKLELVGDGGPVEVEARVVRYRGAKAERISFHHELGRYDGRRGRLALDDGTVVDVTVNGPYLEVNHGR